jgi:glycosyltransferase Alg8
MLRNGARAIALGPTAMPFFIWWCVVDQRIAMWTMMVSPVMAVLGSLAAPGYFWNCLIWVLFSRVVLCLFLFGYSRRADMSWPFILYLNQVINASVKIFMIFHLSKQKWSNRGNQSSGDGGGRIEQARNLFAKFQLVTAVTTFVVIVMIYIGLLAVPIG